ncbi:hypothetical protein [Fortiea contorta]|uniref:hypothetical protein n=1 Tax=Fortiea contorta TaxID=1892405 RepID=UPI0012B6600F|nr:hypothetical protein [Fortiea contorta]
MGGWGDGEMGSVGGVGSVGSVGGVGSLLQKSFLASSSLRLCLEKFCGRKPSPQTFRCASA